MEAAEYIFRIADFDISIVFADVKTNNVHLIPSFETFEVSTHAESPLFNLTVDDSLVPINKDKLERIGEFETGNGVIAVSKTTEPTTTYQFIINNISGHSCCLLQTYDNFAQCKCALNGNQNMRRFGLNNALMLIFAFKSSFHNTLMIHASSVKHNSRAYAFIAKSGTGKSTHSALWMKHIANTELINDDTPIVRMIGGIPYLYGSPWSGKTPCYRNIRVKLGAITRIERATTNSIEQLSPTKAFASIMPSCSTMKWDKTIFDNLCKTIGDVIRTTKTYTLHCLPDKDAATICHKTISK